MSDKSQTTIVQEMTAYKVLGSLDQRDAVATNELSNVIDALRSDLSTKLDCETGNPIVSGAVKTLSGIQTSGDIEIYGHTIKVLSGNYIQTDDALGYVQNYSARNSFLQAECSQKYYDRYGIACTGSKGYCILSINTSQRYIRLSGDLTQLIEFHNLCANAQFSISFGSGAYSQELKITDIIQDNAEWGHIITDIATKIGDQTSATCIDNWKNDDNAFYCPKAPHIGNTVIPAFYGSHAEGAATKAIQRCTHAEGRNTLADIRYSHAEGSDTYAAEMWSHAEGGATKALGRASHSEGYNTTAKGANSHAEGEGTQANGYASHASGMKAIATENFSFAWSGISSTTAYSSHGQGTFNINPVSGISGFWIGKKNLGQYINEISSSITSIQDDCALKTEQISDISVWLDSKFEYPVGDSLSVKTNTLFESGATVSSSLSIGEDIAVARNLSVRNRITSFDVVVNGISSSYLSSNEISAGKLTAPFNGIHNSGSSGETLQSVHNFLSSAIDKKIFAGDYNEKHISNLTADSLSILRIGHDEFAEKVLNGNTNLSDKILYVVSSDNLDFYGERGINLADPHDLSDATNKKYVDSSIVSVNTSIGVVSNDLLETMSKISGDLGEAISSKIYIEDRVGEDGELVSSYSDLSVIKLSSREYQDLVVSGTTSPSALYIVESDFINAYGQQIKNLSAPGLSSDAATKAYVDERFNSISSNSIISSAFNSINTGGVAGITLEQSICVIYELVKILGYNDQLR